MARMEIVDHRFPDGAIALGRGVDIDRAAAVECRRLDQHLEIARGDHADDARCGIEPARATRKVEVQVFHRDYQLRKRRGGSYSPPDARTRSLIERAASRSRVAMRLSMPRSSARRTTPRWRSFSTIGLSRASPT